MTPRAADAVVVATDEPGDIGAGVDLRKARLATATWSGSCSPTTTWSRTEPSTASAPASSSTPTRTAKGPEFEFVGGLFQGTDYVLAETDGWKRGKHGGR